MSTISVDNFQDKSAAESVDSAYVVHGTLKSWVNSAQDGTVADSLNVSGVTDDATGKNTVSYTTSFTGTTYSPIHKSDRSMGELDAVLAGSTGTNHRSSGGALIDVTALFSLHAVGDLA